MFELRVWWVQPVFQYVNKQMNLNLCTHSFCIIQPSTPDLPQATQPGWGLAKKKFTDNTFFANNKLTCLF